VAQLTRSLEADRSEAGEKADGPSPELRALQEGLNAVRASSEVSDRRTQETLQAVHETLEQIVAKLAELEAEDEPDDGDGRTADSGIGRGVGRRAAAEPMTELEDVAEEPVEEAREWAAEEISREPEAPVDHAEDVADDVTAMDSRAEGFVFPEQPTKSRGGSRSGAVRRAAGGGPRRARETETWAETSAAPSDPPVREDYIAAARRAAQMASRKQNPLTSGFNKFSQSMSGGAKADGTTEPGTQKRGFISSLFGRRKDKQGDDAPGGGRQDVQAQAPHLRRPGAAGGGVGLRRPAQQRLACRFRSDRQGAPHRRPERHDSGPEALSDIWPLGALTTASLAPAAETAGKRVASGVTLPENRTCVAPPGGHRGDAVAQFVVAGRYLDGRAVARNEAQAAQWYERAAEQGLAAAQYRLGSMYEHGRGKPVDREQAVALYEQAAAAGNINAMHNLAVLRIDASSRRDYAQAASWFRKAAERGLKDSQFNLAVLHERGLGVPRNPENAVFWYSLAAVQGDEEAAAKAKALEADLAPDAARQVRIRLMDWRALPADQKANVVPVDDPSWQELS
jgi:localization factor PodJL